MPSSHRQWATLDDDDDDGDVDGGRLIFFFLLLLLSLAQWLRNFPPLVFYTYNLVFILLLPCRRKKRDGKTPDPKPETLTPERKMGKREENGKFLKIFV